MCVDLVKQNYGHTIDVYSWRDEYHDPQVWEEIANGRTLGIFQIETSQGTRYTKQFQPRSLARACRRHHARAARPGALRPDRYVLPAQERPWRK
jgi:DNA polymerase III alpha subunit